MEENTILFILLLIVVVVISFLGYRKFTAEPLIVESAEPGDYPENYSNKPAEPGLIGDNVPPVEFLDEPEHSA